MRTQILRESQLGAYVDLPNQGLAAYFSHVREGQPVEYRTTFYKGMSPHDVLAQWEPTLSTLRADLPGLVQFEDDLGSKVGPMSIMKPLCDRMSDIESYYDSILLESEPVLPEAISRAVKQWSLAKGIRPRNQAVTLDNMKLSTNSGLPFFTKRRNVTRLTLPCAVYEDTPFVEQELSLDNYRAAAVLGWRGQEGGPSREDVKQRVVWMFPFAVNLQELEVYQPVIQAFQHHGLNPAWISLEAVERHITNLFDTKGPNDVVMCTDFSKFDQHFNTHLQAVARECLSSLMTPGYQSWFDNVFPIKYMIPLMYDMGKLAIGPHGMASGSGGTNCDESLAHSVLQHEAALDNHVMLNPFSTCLGDDGILSFPGLTVKKVLDSYTRHGLDMNEDKQFVSRDEAIYLRRWYSTGYRSLDGTMMGVYSTNRALGRLCEQERFYDADVWGPKAVALRQLSIIENCNRHPLFEEFVRFCMKGDKYRLGLDIPGFISGINSVAADLSNYMPDFLGYTRNNMEPVLPSKWRVIEYLSKFL